MITHDHDMKLNHAALRVIRGAYGFTQTAVAEGTGIDRSNYAHIEAGRRRGTPAQIRSIANFLSVPVAALLGPEGDPPAADEVAA
jgi:transcriptional regulator with XRE-family HTH domain